MYVFHCYRQPLQPLTFFECVIFEENLIIGVNFYCSMQTRTFGKFVCFMLGNTLSLVSVLSVVLVYPYLWSHVFCASQTLILGQNILHCTSQTLNYR